MTLTRENKFKLAFDSFINDVVGCQNYDLKNLTKNKKEAKHVYSFSIPAQTIVLGFIDRTGVTHTGIDVANMSISTDLEEIKTDYTPEKETFEKQFAATFDPYRERVEIPAMNPNRPPYIFNKSYVEIDQCEVNEETGDLEGKLYVAYYKKHIPYYVEKDDGVFEKKYSGMLHRFNHANTLLNVALNDIDDLQDDLLYNERKLRSVKKVLFRETANHKLSENNLINKLHDAYCKSDTKDECPVCYETIENDKLIIPRCAHYICNECHPRCDTCPVCRSSYTLGV